MKIILDYYIYLKYIILLKYNICQIIQFIWEQKYVVN